MKKKTLIVEDSEKLKRKNFFIKLAITIVLTIFCIILVINTIKVNLTNKKFADQISDISKINSQTIFSIDRIYLYSSADAKSNETNKPIWDLDIYQFTDIALYINNRDEDGVTYSNTIKELSIDNVRFNNLETGTPKLYYKNVEEFAKLDIIEENEITDKLDFNIVNSGTVDYAKPILYSNCQNPITLEYVNSKMKEETKITDISTPLTYDGSLLKKSGILLSKIGCMLSFRVTIINNYDQKFEATVYIDIPIEDKFNNTNIYDGKVIKNIENTNIVKFIRTE